MRNDDIIILHLKAKSELEQMLARATENNNDCHAMRQEEFLQSRLEEYRRAAHHNRATNLQVGIEKTIGLYGIYLIKKYGGEQNG